MEGTGIAGGLPTLVARALFNTKYVVSSGDAVGPYVGNRRPSLRAAAWLYEWLLLRHCSAFLGWTPYLVGRALTFGAPVAATVPGWAPGAASSDARSRTRAELNISEDTIVFGLVGSLRWSPRFQYCYGVELVRAITSVVRDDVAVVIAGGGSGLPHLKRLAGQDLGHRVKLIGQVARERVPDYLAACDVASLPQSCDQVGQFRYSTKLPEYLAHRLPIVTGRLPVAYDLGLAWSWRLPGTTPWSEEYVQGLADLMRVLTREEVESRRPSTEDQLVFAPGQQIERVKALVGDLLTAAV